MHRNRPQAPGYLANLMARLFHDVSEAGLGPLGIRAAQFPILIELWFGPGASRASLAASQEMDAAGIDAIVRSLASDGLIGEYPSDPAQTLVLTERGRAVRDPAVAAARRANQTAAAVLSEPEMEQFLGMMNRVIDALQAAKT